MGAPPIIAGTKGLVAGTELALTSLGEKDHSLPGQGLDPSDADGGANTATWPVSGYYMPDGSDATRSRGVEYLVTANEGDAREYDCFEEEARVKDLDLEGVLLVRASDSRRDLRCCSSATR